MTVSKLESCGLAGYLGSMSTKHRSSISAATAARSRLMTQVLSGIKAIKMYAMEEIFQDLVGKARK